MAEYQWYPGHMTKAKRMMQEDIKLIDLVIELVDARVPLGSRNPDIDELGKNKSRIILLNKSDLADAKKNKLWMGYFADKGFHALEINAKTGTGVKSIQGVVQEACRDKIERDRKRGIKNRPVRAQGDPQQTCACHGGRDSKCRQVHVHQLLCGAGMCQNRKQTRRDKGETVDPPEQRA